MMRKSRADVLSNYWVTNNNGGVLNSELTLLSLGGKFYQGIAATQAITL